MSSSTPKASVVVTAWARKFSVFVFVLAVISIGLYALHTTNNDNEGSVDSDGQSTVEECTNIGLQDTCVLLEVVSSPEDRRRGLSGRESLPDNAGMLFDFQTEAIRCMWMPDMNFSIDIIWLDEAGEVVDVITGVSPETYPERFCGDVPAQYVIELNAGVADEVEVSIGQSIDVTPLMVR